MLKRMQMLGLYITVTVSNLARSEFVFQTGASMHINHFPSSIALEGEGGGQSKNL